MQRVIQKNYFLTINVDNIIKWVFGTCMGISGAILVALNFEYSKYGYVLFTISSFAWIYISSKRKDRAMFVTQFVFIAIDSIGIFKWMIL